MARVAFIVLASLARARFGDRQGVARALSIPCVVVCACNRPVALRAALASWRAAGISPTVSVDCPGQLVPNVVRDMGLSMRWSHQVHVPPDGSDERVSRHWLNAVSAMFKRPECEWVVYAEDDHVVAPTFYKDLWALIYYAKIRSMGVFALNMGCHGDCWGKRSLDPGAVGRMEPGNMGVVYIRPQWEAFVGALPKFCSLLGGWDVNMHVLGAQGHIPQHALTYLRPRIAGIGSCTSSRMKTRVHGPCDDREQAERALHGLGLMLGPLKLLHDVGPVPYVLQQSAPTAPERLQRLCMASLAN